jgi:transglutaminase-like putative cysteine protease
MTHWLEETRQLDLSHPKLRITAQKLTQSRQCLHARAASIHEFVRRMPFVAVPRASALRASDVLLRGHGDCHAKGLLFVALCRAAGLPARLLLVRVKAGFLAGMLDGGPEAITHAVGQVRIGDQWVSTDGYVIDPPMFALAKYSLDRTGRDSGWGIVRHARGRWDGKSTCIQQFRASDMLETVGVFADLDAADAAHPPEPRGWLERAKYAIGARLVNRRVARLRRERWDGALRIA